MQSVTFHDWCVKNNSQLLSEWHPTKNGNLTPYEVSPYSHLKVWWKCSKGHEWGASIYGRVIDCGCPYCSNKKILIDYNDLQTTNPELASEWHPMKNGDLTPTGVIIGSHNKVWWKCKKGHEWNAGVSRRKRGGPIVIRTQDLPVISRTLKPS